MNIKKKNIPKTFVDVYYAVYIFVYDLYHLFYLLTKYRSVQKGTEL